MTNLLIKVRQRPLLSAFWFSLLVFVAAFAWPMTFSKIDQTSYHFLERSGFRLHLWAFYRPPFVGAYDVPVERRWIYAQLSESRWQPKELVEVNRASAKTDKALEFPIGSTNSNMREMLDWGYRAVQSTEWQKVDVSWNEGQAEFNIAYLAWLPLQFSENKEILDASAKIFGRFRGAFHDWWIPRDNLLKAIHRRDADFAAADLSMLRLRGMIGKDQSEDAERNLLKFFARHLAKAESHPLVKQAATDHVHRHQMLAFPQSIEGASVSPIQMALVQDWRRLRENDGVALELKEADVRSDAIVMFAERHGDRLIGLIRDRSAYAAALYECGVMHHAQAQSSQRNVDNRRSIEKSKEIASKRVLADRYLALGAEALRDDAKSLVREGTAIALQSWAGWGHEAAKNMQCQVPAS